MKLTICLVTKGREGYLDQMLESLVPLIANPLNSILIIDNGSSMPSRGRLSAWRSEYYQSVSLVRLDYNDSRPASYWNIVKELSSDWIIFPGDDDVFHPEIVSEWRTAVTKNPELVAYATSGAVIDEVGRVTGEILNPSIARCNSVLDRVASALHEPPFVWPGLFFKLSKLPKAVPTSRFAFDWWVSLQLLVSGEVQVSESIGINYRAHGQQESALAPLRRKFLEDQIWINRFIGERQFWNWIVSLSDEDKVEFWNLAMARKPIYGDEIFSAPILLRLLEVLDESTRDIEFSAQMFGKYAFTKGVFLKNGEVKNLLRYSGPASDNLESNVNLSCSSNSCENLIKGCLPFNSAFKVPTLIINCKHSQDRSTNLTVDCSHFSDGTNEVNSDIISTELTSLFENNGELNLLLSSGERSFIFQLRRWKGYIPGKVINFLKKLKR